MQRPTAVTVFGILNIVFGIFAVLSMVIAAAFLGASGQARNPAINMMMQSGVMGAWMKVSMVLGGIAAIVEIASGIGLLQLQEWGRKAALGYGIYTIIAGIIGAVMSFVFVVSPMMAQAGSSDPAVKAMAIGGAIGGVAGSCGGLIYPICLLFFMTRPEVVAAFLRPVPPAIPPTAPDSSESSSSEPPSIQSF